MTAGEQRRRRGSAVTNKNKKRPSGYRAPASAEGSRPARKGILDSLFSPRVPTTSSMPRVSTSLRRGFVDRGHVTGHRGHDHRGRGGGMVHPGRVRHPGAVRDHGQPARGAAGRLLHRSHAGDRSVRRADRVPRAPRVHRGPGRGAGHADGHGDRRAADRLGFTVVVHEWAPDRAHGAHREHRVSRTPGGGELHRAVAGLGIRIADPAGRARGGCVPAGLRAHDRGDASGAVWPRP